MKTYQNKKSKNLRNNIIVIALSAILVVMLILFYMQRREHGLIMKDITAEKDSIQQERLKLWQVTTCFKTENDTINEQ